MSDKPWIAQYQENVSPEIDTTKYDSIAELFDESVKKYEDLPAFHNMGTNMSYGELGVMATQFASYLQNDLGLKKATE